MTDLMERLERGPVICAEGYLFELERRGASEVVALDIPDHRYWDWPARVRAKGPERLAERVIAWLGAGTDGPANESGPHPRHNSAPGSGPWPRHKEGQPMAAMKPRTGDGPLEVTKEVRGIVLRMPLEGGGRLVVEMNAEEATALGDAIKDCVG